jgi:hypothetical protein
MNARYFVNVLHHHHPTTRVPSPYWEGSFVEEKVPMITMVLSHLLPHIRGIEIDWIPILLEVLEDPESIQTCPTMAIAVG